MMALPLGLKKYRPIIVIPVRKAKMAAVKPLLPVFLNTSGKQAAPMMLGTMMAME